MNATRHLPAADIAKLRQLLKDPYSVRSAEISAPAPGWVGIIYGGTQNVGCVRYKASAGTPV